MGTFDNLISSVGAWVALAVIVVGGIGKLIERRLHVQARLLEDLKVVAALKNEGPPFDKAAILVKRSIIRTIQRHYVPTNRWLNGFLGIFWATVTILLAAVANVLVVSKSFAGAITSMVLASAAFALALSYFGKVGQPRFESDKDIAKRVREMMKELEVPSARQRKTGVSANDAVGDSSAAT